MPLTGRFVALDQTKAGLLVPGYQYPTSGLWPAIAALGAAGGIKYAVANVASGPGSSVNSDWTTAITNAKNAGVTVVGYVDTNFGGVAAATAEANAASWFSFYGTAGLAGIFLDRVSANAAGLGYVGQVVGAIRQASPGIPIILNHGTVPIEDYADLGDVLVVFEDVGSNWPPASFPASWMADYDPDKFAVLAYSVTSQATAEQIIAQVLGDGIGNVFISDSSTWSDVPSYWAHEAAQAEGDPGQFVATGDHPVMGTSYRQQGPSASAGVSGAFGSPVSITPLPDSGYSGVEPVAAYFTPTGVAAGETLTMQFTATFSDGTTQASGNITTAAGSNSNVAVNEVQAAVMAKDGVYLTGLSCKCSSNQGTTSATCKLTLVGANIG